MASNDSRLIMARACRPHGSWGPPGSEAASSGLGGFGGSVWILELRIVTRNNAAAEAQDAFTVAPVQFLVDRDHGEDSLVVRTAEEGVAGVDYALVAV